MRLSVNSFSDGANGVFSLLLLRAIVLKSLTVIQTVTEIVLQTLLTEVERLINGCALNANSDGPHDPQPITPSHFIMQKKTTCLSPGSFGRADQFHQRKWRQVQFLADLFWKRCLQEYRPSLQNREKWHGALPNLKLNALVSLANENASRGRRNLGRIDQKLRPRESNYKDL